MKISSQFLKIVLFMLLFGWSNYNAFGQSFQATSNTPKINTTNTYIIKLNPNFTQHTLNNLSDLRLYSSKGIEIPYKWVFSSNSYYFNTNKISLNFEIKTNSKNTEIKVFNPDKNTIEHLYLKISNTNVVKKAKCLGSHNQKDWFIIAEDLSLHPSLPDSLLHQHLELWIPANKYPYILINVNDSLSSPYQFLDIYKLQTNSQFIANNSWDTISTFSPNFTPNQKENTTRISFPLKYNSSVDAISIQIANAKFSRNLNIYGYLPHPKKDRKYTKQLLGNFLIENKHNFLFRIKSIGYEKIELEIQNNDDYPLEIKKIHALSMSKYIAANLNKNEIYTLKIGNSTLKAPIYDLKIEESELDWDKNLIFTENTTILSKKESIKSLSSTKKILYISLIVAALVIAIMVFNTLKKIKK